MENLGVIEENEYVLQKLRKLDALIVGFDKTDYGKNTALQSFSINTFKLTSFTNESRSLLAHETATLFTVDGHVGFHYSSSTIINYIL